MTIVRDIIKEFCVESPSDEFLSCFPLPAAGAAGPDVEVADKSKSKYMVSTIVIHCYFTHINKT